MTTFYLDPVNGNDAANGSTFSLGGLPTVGPWKTITGGPTAARIAPGDIIRIAKSPDPTSLGQTALWTDLSKAVVLRTGAVTGNICTCDHVAEAWTAQTHGTPSSDTTNFKMGTTNSKAGNRSVAIAVASAGTNELLAYRDLGATGLDLSGYQQVSFWIRNTVAIVANNYALKLCSDRAGATPVNTIPIPAIPSTAQWVCITVDLAGALGNPIKSVALYSGSSAPSNGTVNFDNILACKASSSADSLTLQSLISKNSAAQGGTEYWYPIQSINGATILIDNHTNCLGNAGRGYTGTTETVTTYKRETIKTAMAAANNTTVATIQDSGSSGNYIEFQGGYNTSNNTQDGETIFDGQSGWGNGLDPNTKQWVKIAHVHFCRYSYGLYWAAAKMFYLDGWTFGNTNPGISFRGLSVVNGYYKVTSYNNGSMGIDYYDAAGIVADFISLNNTSDGIRMYGVGNIINSLMVKNNGAYGLIGPGTNNVYRNITSASNSGFYNGQSTFKGRAVFKNATISEATIVNNLDSYSYSNGRFIFENFGGVATDHRIYTDWGNIFPKLRCAIPPPVWPGNCLQPMPGGMSTIPSF